MASPTTQNAAQRLNALGQSVWLDFISRSLITSGELARMVREGLITGMTSNPTIFEKAIAGTPDYDETIRRLAGRERMSGYDAFVELAAEDIRAAADAFRPVYDRTAGVDGYISFELPPGIEHDTEKSVAEAHRLFDLVGRPNVMIKVPGTAEGMPVLRQLVAGGLNPNMTLLFGIGAYEQCAEAYLAGLEDRMSAGKPVDRIASVASFFVSRVDTLVDKLLPDKSPLRGKAAVANARYAYSRFLEVFSGPRWERLAAAGAHVQRPLWASTSTKNDAYPDVLYVDNLVAPNTVNTMPAKTLEAVLDHGRVEPAIVNHIDDARNTLVALREAGVDMKKVTDQLLEEGLASFEKDFLNLLKSLESSLAVIRVGSSTLGQNSGELQQAVGGRLDRMRQESVTPRIWSGDHTVWKPDPTEISNRLGWLNLPETMKPELPGLRAFGEEVRASGYRTAVLFGMGGSSLAPEVLHDTLGTAPGYLDLEVLDATDPGQISGLERRLDLNATLFIVASKSGSTIETLSQFAYFWSKLPDGAHFVAITDPASSLERLATERGFRRVFANPPEIGGRYSALSFFGLVPAALIGADLDALLDDAAEMMHACGAGVDVASNPGAWLGAALGEAAIASHDKLTLVLPETLHSLGNWIEQLIAESTGKEGRGIVPIVGEPLGSPDVYGTDRLFVSFGEDAKLNSLASAGHPVVRIPGEARLGSEFYRWEFATAIAGYLLGINPFDQPNVQEAKDATASILGGQEVDETTPTAADMLGQIGAGDYLAILAYIDRNSVNEANLQAIRVALRDRYRVATTVGFGPRFLHSTGQLHKGGPNEGVFLQVVGDDEIDLPIPGREFSFGKLKRAQALGDLASLRAHGRRVSRTSIAHLNELTR